MLSSPEESCMFYAGTEWSSIGFSLTSECNYCRGQNISGQCNVCVHVFKTSLDFLDFRLSQKPHGMLPLLDDETNFPQSSDETYIRKLDKLCDENDRYISSLNGRAGTVGFGVKHFAEQVRPLSQLFVRYSEKKRKKTLVSLVQLL